MWEASYDRLTQLDNSFLVYERLGAAMHVGVTQIYEAEPLRGSDGAIDIDQIQEYVLSRLHRIPRYRQRLAWTPVEGHPIWIDDVRFNIRYHVRHSRLPRPGSERLLKRMVGRIFSQQLDRGKPLWEMWVIEGVEGDRVAIVSKVHHCMVDGVSGADLMSVLMTTEPSEKIESPPAWVPRSAPGTVELWTDQALRVAATPLRLASGLLRLARDEDHARHDLTERGRATARLLASGLRPVADTPLNQPIGPYRRIDWCPMDLGAVRAVKRALGASVNDVVLATTAGAVRRFLERSRGVDGDTLDFRIMAPVSVRSDQERGTLGNRVSAWIVDLPVRERDPLRRVETIRDTTAELKRTHQALGADTLTQAAEWTGPLLLALGARLASYGTPFHMVVTNVPGPRQPLYLLGARMLEAHPMVPLMGTLSTGIALFSYGDTLSWGLSADWDLVPDLHDFTLAIADSFQELQRAAAT